MKLNYDKDNRIAIFYNQGLHLTSDNQVTITAKESAAYNYIVSA